MSENVQVSEISALSLRQQAALPILAISRSIAQGARDSGISEKTLRRWLDDPSFRAELDNLRQESYELARKQFQALVPQFVSVLAKEAIENPDPAIRIRAARYAMNYAVKFCELDKLAASGQDIRPDLPDHQ